MTSCEWNQIHSNASFLCGQVKCVPPEESSAAVNIYSVYRWELTNIKKLIKKHLLCLMTSELCHGFGG